MALDTVGDLIAARRKIGWRCDLGQGHQGEVDLTRIDPAVRLANRRPPCRAPGCPGRAIFEDWTSLWRAPLDTIKVNSLAWFERQEQQRAEVEALGWRVEGGKWTAPDAEKPPAGKARGSV